MKLAGANTGGSSQSELHTEIVVGDVQQSAHRFFRRRHDLARPLVASTDHLDAARDIGRDHVAIDGVLEKKLQRAEYFARRGNRNARVAQLVAKAPYSARRQLRQLDVSNRVQTRPLFASNNAPLGT